MRASLYSPDLGISLLDGKMLSVTAIALLRTQGSHLLWSSVGRVFASEGEGSPSDPYGRQRPRPWTFSICSTIPVSLLRPASSAALSPILARATGRCQTIHFIFGFRLASLSSNFLTSRAATKMHVRQGHGTTFLISAVIASILLNRVPWDDSKKGI